MGWLDGQTMWSNGMPTYPLRREPANRLRRTGWQRSLRHRRIGARWNSLSLARDAAPDRDNTVDDDGVERSGWNPDAVEEWKDSTVGRPFLRDGEILIRQVRLSLEGRGRVQDLVAPQTRVCIIFAAKRLQCWLNSLDMRCNEILRPASALGDERVQKSQLKRGNLWAKSSAMWRKEKFWQW